MAWSTAIMLKCEYETVHKVLKRKRNSPKVNDTLGQFLEKNVRFLFFSHTGDCYGNLVTWYGWKLAFPTLRHWFDHLIFQRDVVLPRWKFFHKFFWPIVFLNVVSAMRYLMIQLNITLLQDDGSLNVQLLFMGIDKRLFLCARPFHLR